jgi:2-haloacid dehalogenase
MDQSPFDAAGMDAVVFDVVGTLVDEDATWARAAGRLAGEGGLEDPARLHRHWAQDLDARMHAVIDGAEPWRPHSDLVSSSARTAIAELGGTPSTETGALVSSLDSEYRAWPDVADATAVLRRARLVAGVSNADLSSLARLANLNGISWDAALSTGAVRTFKPAPAAYRYAIETLQIDPRRALFVAAHPWDLRAAAEHGFRTAYIGRPGAERPAASDRFDLVCEDLSQLALLLD